VGLDIALVGLLGLEAPFNDDVCPPEACFDVAVTVFATLGDVGRWLQLRVDIAGRNTLSHDVRRGRYRFVDVDRMGSTS